MILTDGGPARLAPVAADHLFSEQATTAGEADRDAFMAYGSSAGGYERWWAGPDNRDDASHPKPIASSGATDKLDLSVR